MTSTSNPPMPLSPAGLEKDRVESRSWGNFQLLESVGKGSFGEVYRAWDPSLQREIGLKILLPTTSGEESQFEDLLREARALAAVRHANILPIYGVDQHDGKVGFWTDFVRGKTLAQLVREQGPFGYQEAILVGLDLCKALSAVHRAGFLHRDIKAENVMREEGGRILLMDFGLTTLPHLQSNRAGTPHYMAPELFAGVAASVSSEIYAIGVLLFYLVTAEYPGQQHKARSPAQPDPLGEALTAPAPTMPYAPAMHAAGPAVPRSLIDLRPDIPESFARLVDQAIHLDPEKRFSSAGGLSAALSLALAGPVAGEKPVAPDASRKTTSSLWIFAPILTALLLAAAGSFALFPKGRSLLDFAKHSITFGASESLNDEYSKADDLLLRYDKRKNVADAITLLNDVVSHEPTYALAIADLGRANFLQYRVARTPGQLDQARAACNRAITIDPNLAPPYVTLARIDAMAGKTPLATTEVEKALQLDPRSAEAYGAQAEIFDAEGRSDKALESSQRAIDLAPEDWRWPVLLGHYFFVAGKLPEAKEQFRKAVEISPENSIALLDLGLAFLQLENYDDAQKYLKLSAQFEPSYFVYSTLSEVLSAKGNFVDAVEMSKKALDLDKTNYVAWGNLASAYLWSPGGREKAMETYKTAINLAEQARKETSQDAILLATLGGYYADIGKPEYSYRLLRQAVALAPANPNVLFIAGDGYEILHQRDQAIQLIVKSLAKGFHADQLKMSPELAGLRADSRFQEALYTEKQKISLDNSGPKR